MAELWRGKYLRRVYQPTFTNNLQRPELSLKVAHNKFQTFYIEEVGERGCL